MAARAAELGDIGESAPEHWEHPLGTSEVHVAVAVLSSSAEHLEAMAGRARSAQDQVPGVELIWRQECYQLPTGRTSFGFKDGIGQPAIEGSGDPADESDAAADQGRRVHSRVSGRDRLAAADAHSLGARTQRHLHRLSQAPHSGCRISPLPPRKGRSRARTRRCSAQRWSGGGKAAHRWRSLPSSDDPELGADDTRNNAFLYGDDPRGFKCPAGSHARRANPRDAFDDDGGVDVRLHHMIRRGTSYGPMLPAIRN